jgi:head-tail adaptor
VKAPRAGELDRPIVLETLAVTQDAASGEETRALSSSLSVWARVKPARGSEAYQGSGGSGGTGEVVARARLVFEVRWSPEAVLATPSPDYRINFDGRLWDITAVTEIGRRERLSIEAQARAE